MVTSILTQLMMVLVNRLDAMSILDNQSVMDDERSAALGYTHSMIGSRAGSVIGGPGGVRTMSPTQSIKSSRMSSSHLDAPIHDDGFGGTVSGTGQDILAGGLFEDGSLFDDAAPPPSLPASERVPESNYDDHDNFGGPPSPGPSSLGGSRPATPLENPTVMDQDSSPLSPTPSHTSTVAQSVRSHASTVTYNNVAQEDPAVAVDGGDVCKRHFKKIYSMISMVDSENLSEAEVEKDG